MAFTALTDDLFREKCLIWVVVLGKACSDALCLCLSMLVDHGVSSVEDGSGVSPPLGIGSALD